MDYFQIREPAAAVVSPSSHTAADYCAPIISADQSASAKDAYFLNKAAVARINNAEDASVCDKAGCSENKESFGRM